MKRVLGKPLTSDEIYERASRSVRGRAGQSVEFADRYTDGAFRPLQGRPLTSDEIGDQTFQRTQDRAKRETEFRKAHRLATEGNPLGGPRQRNMDTRDGPGLKRPAPIENAWLTSGRSSEFYRTCSPRSDECGHALCSEG